MTNKRALTVLSAAVLAAVLPTSDAAADETNTHSHNGFTLLSVGQIDDPAEDVLEHATVFGETRMTEGAEAPDSAETPEAPDTA
ncbi:hypothetical protein [Streptomyces sp. NPDC058665]|uniref:hypothetical protein n=1 Tax=Streptomyces sp. NPDC058665 TaxID=3346586 RepID=UPI00365E40F1